MVCGNDCWFTFIREHQHFMVYTVVHTEIWLYSHPNSLIFTNYSAHVCTAAVFLLSNIDHWILNSHSHTQSHTRRITIRRQVTEMFYKLTKKREKKKQTGIWPMVSLGRFILWHRGRERQRSWKNEEDRSRCSIHQKIGWITFHSHHIKCAYDLYFCFIRASKLKGKESFGRRRCRSRLLSFFPKIHCPIIKITHVFKRNPYTRSKQ